MSLSGQQLVGKLVIKTDHGVGCRAEVEKEVVFMGVAFFAKGLVESEDASKPWCYHASRDALLQMATTLRAAGHLQMFGVDGPAVKLAIPGTPFPLGTDFLGDQTQDAGGHLTLYVRPGWAANGAPYTPPDTEAALQMVGQQHTFTLLPPEEGLKVLVASEGNDMKTGVCYYLGVTFADSGTATANKIKAAVGLPADSTQRFHLSIAGLAPAWQPVHPKSLFYRTTGKHQQETLKLQDDFQLFRKGSEVFNFVGFNADGVTGWKTYAAEAAAMGKENGRIGKAVADLSKEPQSAERDAAMAKLNTEKKDIVKTLGFPKSVERGHSGAVAPEAFRAAMPDQASQAAVMETMGPKALLWRP